MKHIFDEINRALRDKKMQVE
jgi:Ca2+-binding EF-hand superfamily protein